jgi:hypothetical protein
MTLSFRGEESVAFAAGWYCWLSIKRFTSTPGARDARQLIGELMAHAEYGDSYINKDSRGRDVHAKWIIAELTPTSYRACTAGEAWASLTEFAVEPGVDDPDAKLLYDELVSRVMAKPGEFWAMDAGRSAEHEFAWILDYYREFLWISEARNEVLLIVAAAD